MSAFTSEYVSLMIARNMFYKETQKMSFCLGEETHDINMKGVTVLLTMRMKKMKKTKVVK